jgi:hypothetical protein
MKLRLASLSLVLLLLGASAASADVIELKIDPRATGDPAWKASLGKLVRTGEAGPYLRGKIRSRARVVGRDTVFVVSPLLQKEGRPQFGSEAESVQIKMEWVSRILPEIDSHEDVDAIVSNRELLFSSADAARELLKAVDPDGSLGIATASAAPPKPVAGAPQLSKGWLERYLVDGWPTDKNLARQQLDQLKQEIDNGPPAGRDKFYPTITPRSPEETMTGLVLSHARVTKLGTDEPARGGRAFVERLREVGNLLVRDLARARPEAAKGAMIDTKDARGRALRSRDFAQRARATLVALVGLGAPEVAAQPYGQDREIPLTGADVARSAASFIATEVRDPAGGWVIAGMTTPGEESRNLVEALIGAASATPGELSDSMLALVLLVDAGEKWPFKTTVVAPPAPADDKEPVYRTLVNEFVDDADPNRARVAQESLLLAGIGTDGQVRETLESVFRVALPSRPPVPGSSDEVRRMNAVRALRYLAGAAKREHAKVVKEAVEERIAAINRRDQAGVITDVEKRFLDDFRAGNQ